MKKILFLALVTLTLSHAYAQEESENQISISSDEHVQLDIIGASVFGVESFKPANTILQLLEPKKIIHNSIGTNYGFAIKLKGNMTSFKFKTETIDLDTDEIIDSSKLIPKDGYLYKSFMVNKKTKKGSYVENIYANDNLIKSFNFEIR